MKMHASVFAVVGLGLVIGVASAAPRTAVTPPRASTSRAAKPARGRACAATTPPTKAQCFSSGYLASPCGKKFQATCKPFVEEALADLYTGSAVPVVQLLRPKKHEIPADLRDGKVWEYGGPKSTTALVGTYPALRQLTGKHANKLKTKLDVSPLLARANPAQRSGAGAKPRKTSGLAASKKLFSYAWLTADNVFSRSGLTRPPAGAVSVDLAKNAHRNPAWEANGEKIESCEEYGYEKIYDWARFTDAMAACSGDHHCQIEVAYLPGTPGIAGRTLKSRDGKSLTLNLQPSGLAFTKLPKNDMFALGAKFARAAGGDGLPPNSDIEELVAALEAGQKHYAVGPSESGPTGFKDMWDYHRKLYERNKTLSAAEFEEYEHRKQQFRELVSQWAVAMKKELKKSPLVEQHMWIDPLDTLTANPWERTQMMQGMLKTADKGVKSMQKQRPGLFNKLNGAGMVNQPVGPAGGAGGQVGRLDQVQPAVGVLASMKKPGAKQKPSSSNANGRALEKLLRVPGYSCAAKDFDVILEVGGIGPASCRIGRFLREEWARKKKGHKSCLDIGNDDCDWSPEMFESMFAKSLEYVDDQNKAETRCVDWTGDSFSAPLANIAAMETYINETALAAGEALRALRPYEQGTGPHGKQWGRGWDDQDYFGDKDWFAAGYDYDLGWDVSPVASSGKKVCQLGAGARGGFGVDGWFVNNKFEVVDGLATADYNRGASKDGKVHAHLRVLGADVFPKIDEVFHGAWNSGPHSKEIQIPSGMKPSFNFMAGPVPVTGAVWGEFFYGARFKASLLSETNASCDLKTVKFGATATFSPELGLNAKAQVGVGISGLLSAGVRGLVNLITVGVPVTASIKTNTHEVAGQLQTRLDFDLDVKLSLATLSGWLAVYIEALLYEEEFVLFRWNGLGPETISLLGEPLKASLPVAVMGK